MSRPAIDPQLNIDDIARAESYLFELTPAAIKQGDGALEVVGYNALIPNYLGANAELYQVNEDSAYAALLPASADMINRGLIDPLDEDLEELLDESDKQNKEFLNHLNRNFNNPEYWETIFVGIGVVTFRNVILRPDGLNIPKVDTLHSSHLGDMSSDQYANNFRYGYNTLSKIGERTNVKYSRGLRASRFVIAETNMFDVDRMVEYIRNSGAKTDIAVARVLNDLLAGSFSRAMLPLFSCDAEVAKELKDRFIERSIRGLEEDPRYANVIDPYMKTIVSDDTKRHVLRGDSRGGGHHLNSLDPRFCQVVGPVEYLESQLFEGKIVRVPIARMQKLDGKGNVVSDNVTSFFPVEWTPEEVIANIKSPSRIRYIKEEPDGTQISFVYSAGLLIKRVSAEISDDSDDLKLITAHPATPIPPEMEKRLRK